MKSRVGWVLYGDANLASSRLQGYRIHEYLCRQGIDSEIAAINAGLLENKYTMDFLYLFIKLLRGRYQAVFFQKPGWMMFKLSEMLRINGIKTAAIQCDPFPGDYCNSFDRVIVTSRQLRDVLGAREATVIDDMLEVPHNVYKHDYKCQGSKLRLVWTGQGLANYVTEFLRNLAHHPLLRGHVDIIKIGPADWADIKWDLHTVYNNILSCDIAVIPLPSSQWTSTKSTNRLTQFMALGMPTVASPIRSYVDLAHNNAPFIIAQDLDDFAQAVASLKTETARAALGVAARNFALSYYSPEAIGPAWLGEVHRLLAANSSSQIVKPHTQLAGKIIGTLAKMTLRHHF